MRVSGAAEMTAFYSDYDDYIDAVIDELEPFGDARELRHDELVDEATEKLDDAQKELDDAKAEADKSSATRARSLPMRAGSSTTAGRNTMTASRSLPIRV